MSASPEIPADDAHRLQRYLLWGSVALITLVAFETLAVATAMPTVARALDGMSLYALVFGAPLAAQLFATPLGGAWCDARGVRGCLYTGITLFAGGLLVCGLSPTMEVLVSGRVLQGLGGGFLIVPLYVLVGSVVAPVRRPAFFAAFSAAWVVPSLVGPMVAGLVVEQFSWRWIFLSVPPLAVAAMVVLRPVLRDLAPRGTVGPTDAAAREAGTAPAAPARSASNTRRIILAAAGAGLAAAVLQGAAPGEGSSVSWVTGVLVVAALAALWFSLPVLLPAGTLAARPGLPAIIASRGLFNGAFISAEIFLPLLLQTLHGWRPVQAGVILTVGSVTWALGSALQGRVVDPGRRTRIIATGSVLLMVGIAVSIASTISSPWFVLAGWAVAGTGIGLAFPALSVAALGITPTAEHGRVSSSLQIADNLGAALAIAASGAVFLLLVGRGAVPFAAGLALSGAVALLSFVTARRTSTEAAGAPSGHPVRTPGAEA